MRLWLVGTAILLGSVAIAGAYYVWGTGAVMQAVLFVIGWALIGSAVGKFLQRREDYENELQDANYERKAAVFWGMSTLPNDETIRQIKQKDHGTRWERFKFMAGVLTMGITGGLIFLFWYLNMEPPKEPWRTDILRIYVVAGVVGFFAYYHYRRTILKMDRQIRWLEMMLKNVYRDEGNLQTRMNGLRDN
jgi:hypothetical protein